MNQEATEYIQIAIARLHKAEGLSDEAKVDLIRRVRLAANQALARESDRWNKNYDYLNGGDEEDPSQDIESRNTKKATP